MDNIFVHREIKPNKGPEKVNPSCRYSTFRPPPHTRDRARASWRCWLPWLTHLAGLYPFP